MFSSLLPLTPNTAADAAPFEVANVGEMLALPALVGDFALRADTKTAWQLRYAPATILANWEEFPAGTTINWTGAWNSGTAYAIFDVISHQGSSYLCLQAHTNEQPPSGTYWGLLAQKGDQGNQGVKGDKGDKGDPGDPGSGGTNLEILTTVYTASSLPDNEFALIVQDMGRFWALYAIQSNQPAWVNIYQDLASANADVRTEELTGTRPAPGNGYLAEFLFSAANQTIICAPIPLGQCPTNSGRIKVKNLSGGTATINLTLQYTRFVA